jgi:hypothetical protein
MVAGRIALFVLVTGATTAAAREAAAPGSWVGLEVEVGGRTSPLYASADGTRFYVEARKGRDYELRLVNRTGERVAVELTVDGLNVISGERNKPGADRMYVLGPYESSEIRGWRTSLDEVRRFTFVDEQASYATRAGKANGKMGWIEMAVYRERHRPRRHMEDRRWRPFDDGAGAPAAEGEADAQEPGEEPHAKSGSSGSRDEAAPSARAQGRDRAPAAPRSYPGTGWGDRMEDSVRLVDFEAEATPIQTLTVRYEYRSALYALGVLPSRSRLDQRERGEYGFAQPPRW